MKKIALAVLFGCIVALASTAAEAKWVTIFSDNFDTENDGVGEYNYTNFASWTVKSGTVDLHSWDDWYYQEPESYGRFVDLDGSTGEPGTIRTKGKLHLKPGKYRISFDFASNAYPDSGTNTAQFKLAYVMSRPMAMRGGKQFHRLCQAINVRTPVDTYLMFRSLSTGDCGGIFIDNIRLEHWVN